jgi:hypothetical protein
VVVVVVLLVDVVVLLLVDVVVVDGGHVNNVSAPITPVTLSIV